MNSLMEIWNAVQEYCKENMTEIAFKVWIAIISPVDLDENTATLSVNDAFKRNIIESKYTALLTEAYNHVLGFPVDVKIITSNDVLEEETKTEEAQNINLSDDYEYTFDTFIVGSSNKFAHAAAQAVAATPGRAYNPLFIYGNSGLGKTHLIHAIKNEIQEKNPSAKILYLRGEQFTNELVKSLEVKKMAEFHDKYRSVDVLLMDDVQFISGKVQTQEEFFHTFENLYQAGKQIVLTSDRPPKEILMLEERLRSRFESGLLADVQPPEIETRMAIVRRKAAQLDVDLSDEVVEYIAEKIKSNIRQLEGAVKRVKAYHSIEGYTINIALAQRTIRDILSDTQPTPVTVEKIIREVARTYGVSDADIRSTKRDAPVKNARQAAMYIVREVTGLSTKAIGQEFSGRDHSTVIYTLNKVENDMAKNPTLKSTISDIIKNIQE